MAVPESLGDRRTPAELDGVEFAIRQAAVRQVDHRNLARPKMRGVLVVVDRYGAAPGRQAVEDRQGAYLVRGDRREVTDRAILLAARRRSRSARMVSAMPFRQPLRAGIVDARASAMTPASVSAGRSAISVSRGVKRSIRALYSGASSCRGGGPGTDVEQLGGDGDEAGVVGRQPTHARATLIPATRPIAEPAAATRVP